MRLRRSLAICVAWMPMILAAKDAGQNLRFSNKDHLSGELVSLGTSELIWKSPILEHPTPFLLKEVTDLTLPGELPTPAGNHEATVQLTNGDTLRGQLTSVSDEVIELDTTYAGRLSLRRSMVKDLQIEALPDILYRGPSDDLSVWKRSGNKEAWTYEAATLTSKDSGGIARDLKLPEECVFSFDFQWRSTPRLKFIFFSRQSHLLEPTQGYELTVQGRSIRLTKCGDHNWIGNTTAARQLQENEKARIELRASLKTGQFVLSIDGKVIDVWTDPEVLKKTGGGIHFVTLTSSPVKISAIQVSAWDGVVDPTARNNAGDSEPNDEDDDSDEPPLNTQPAPNSGRMRLRNGDSLTGEVLAITDGIITVKTAFAEVKLPVARLRNITLEAKAREEPIRRLGDVRASLPDGSSLVFRLDGLENGVITGTSQNFGTAHLKFSAFSRIEFNIYDAFYKNHLLRSGME